MKTNKKIIGALALALSLGTASQALAAETNVNDLYKDSNVAVSYTVRANKVETSIKALEDKVKEGSLEYTINYKTGEKVRVEKDGNIAKFYLVKEDDENSDPSGNEDPEQPVGNEDPDEPVKEEDPEQPTKDTDATKDSDNITEPTVNENPTQVEKNEKQVVEKTTQPLVDVRTQSSNNTNTQKPVVVENGVSNSNNKEAATNPKTGVVGDAVAIVLMTSVGGYLVLGNNKQRKAGLLALGLAVMGTMGSFTSFAAEENINEVIEKVSKEINSQEIEVYALNEETNELVPVKVTVDGNVSYELTKEEVKDGTETPDEDVVETPTEDPTEEPENEVDKDLRSARGFAILEVESLGNLLNQEIKDSFTDRLSKATTVEEVNSILDEARNWQDPSNDKNIEPNEPEVEVDEVLQGQIENLRVRIENSELDRTTKNKYLFELSLVNDETGLNDLTSRFEQELASVKDENSNEVTTNENDSSSEVEVNIPSASESKDASEYEIND